MGERRAAVGNRGKREEDWKTGRDKGAPWGGRWAREGPPKEIEERPKESSRVECKLLGIHYKSHPYYWSECTHPILDMKG